VIKRKRNIFIYIFYWFGRTSPLPTYPWEIKTS